MASGQTPPLLKNVPQYLDRKMPRLEKKRTSQASLIVGAVVYLSM
jgi:hypothetical protein